MSFPTIPSERGIGRPEPVARKHIWYYSEIPQIKTVEDLSFSFIIASRMAQQYTSGPSKLALRKSSG
jgi:hypothetical protein